MAGNGEIIDSKNILAHKIVYEGREYHMSIVSISEDGCHVSITPFKEEVPGTVFVSGSIAIIRLSGAYIAKKI